MGSVGLGMGSVVNSITGASELGGTGCSFGGGIGAFGGGFGGGPGPFGGSSLVSLA